MSHIRATLHTLEPKSNGTRLRQRYDVFKLEHANLVINKHLGPNIMLKGYLEFGYVYKDSIACLRTET